MKSHAIRPTGKAVRRKASRQRGPGRPAIWKQPILSLKPGNERSFIVAQDKSEAMTIYIAGARMGIKIRVEKQPDGKYRCYRK